MAEVDLTPLLIAWGWPTVLFYLRPLSCWDNVEL